ncbi:major facilitator superfamily transporter [Xylariales sp. PMI_506]|nr:major facilitator superfamily transporter [Xylariales sp. PMI_506]
MAEQHDERTPLLRAESPHNSIDRTSPEVGQDTRSGDDSDTEAQIFAAGSDALDSGVTAVVEANNHTKPSGQAPSLDRSSFYQVVAVLAIGTFTSSLDTSIVLATHPRIASEFHALAESSWLFISYLLAGVATQTLYAKLSDVYGRKWLLVMCYSLFATGLVVVGCAQSMWQVILGRVISGSGGSGMASIGLVLVTDLIPLREVATWHGYINVINTTGRSLGGPIGGWLADQIGWRWSFLGQAPVFAIAIISCIIAIPNTRRASTPQNSSNPEVHLLLRIDFAGILLLGLSVFTLMLPLELGGSKLPWTHPAIYALFAAGACFFLLFLATEAWWAPHPVFPMRLLKNPEIVACYIVIATIAAGQTSLMFVVPLYFQVSQRVSNTVAGAHLLPAVVGNAIGGIAAGRIIRRTGRYKIITLIASIAGGISYFLLILRWRGNTNWWESMYIVLGGLAAGMANTAIFISINAIIEPAHKAVATASLFLSMPVGMITGIAIASALMLQVMQEQLDQNLIKLGLSLVERTEVITKAADNVEYIYQLTGPLADAVSGAYVEGLRWGYGIHRVLIEHLGVSLVCSVTALVAGLTLKNRPLP